MGPLQGVTIVEIASIGPGPMCGMLLSDMGARVIRVDRLEDSGLGLNIPPELDALARGRESIALDLKSETGREIVLKLIEKADGLIEGFRPGVMERLGLGPDVALARNPRLVFGRMTGFGQNGPLAHAAGHDINYIALSGALDAIGRKGEKPVPPLNLVGDFGGGALYLDMGLLAGILHARATGKGDVVDAAMVDGAASLLAMFSGLRAAGQWRDERGVNILDTGAPWSCQPRLTSVASRDRDRARVRARVRARARARARVRARARLLVLELVCDAAITRRGSSR